MTNLDTAAWAMVQPALDAYRSACRVAQVHTPLGVLFEPDLLGIRRRVARDHGMTPEDLARWVDADNARAQRGRRAA